MSATAPLSGDEQTSGVRAKNDAHDPQATSYAFLNQEPHVCYLSSLPGSPHAREECMGLTIGRRELIGALGGAAVWSLGAYAHNIRIRFLKFVSVHEPALD